MIEAVWLMLFVVDKIIHFKINCNLIYGKKRSDPSNWKSVILFTYAPHFWLNRHKRLSSSKPNFVQLLISGNTNFQNPCNSRQTRNEVNKETQADQSTQPPYLTSLYRSRTTFPTIIQSVNEDVVTWLTNNTIIVTAELKSVFE